MGRVFSAYRTLLPSVPSLKYLGQTFSSSDNNCLAVEQNLQRSQVKWGWLEKILEREGADRRIVGRFYVALV